MPRTLVVIDVQNDYFPGGAHPLVGPDAAAAVVADLLARFRERGEPVVFVQHLWDEPDAPYLRQGSAGAQIHPSVLPRDGEPVVTKEFPNAFLHTDLAERLDGADGIVVVGMMTNMCVDATVREAVDRGIDTVLVADGCAASDLAWGGTTVDGATVHTAFLAALADAGATVVPAADLP
ncbi:cysteine hydrolase family protein [Jatrophihabitans sp. YIM 134969]